MPGPTGVAGVISSDIRSMSYRLHPATLEHIGLVEAIRGLCRTHTERHGIPVEFTEGGVPEKLPAETALCLYRIVQESLGNIAKHSNARDARVEITDGPDGIRLRVSDSGVGFNPESVRRAGLGLISMRERLRLIGGEISIDSRPGQGTRIDVRVKTQ